MSNRQRSRRSKITSYLSVSDKNFTRALGLYVILVFVFLYLPVIFIAVVSFTTSRFPGFPIPGYSLEWYAALIPPNYDEALINSLFRSLTLGVISAVITGAIGTLAALGMVRSEFKHVSARALNMVFSLPLMFPWVIMGISVLSLYNLLDVYGSFFSLVIGHVLIGLPYVVLVVASQLYGFDRTLEEAAKNLGASELRTFREVTLPLIFPGIVAGMLFAFTLSFDNFVQTFFWTTRSYQTLPIVIYSRLEYGLTPIVNSISTVVLVFSISVAYLAERLTSFYR